MSNLEYLDGLNYSAFTAPEAQSEAVRKLDAQTILSKYNFNEALREELLDDLQTYIEEEVKISTLEFVNKFFERLGKNKTGYAVARALGFHIYLKDKEGKEIHTQKQIANYFGVCPQMIDLLSKQVQEDLRGIEPITSLAIHKKKYDYSVKAPEGYMTTIQVMNFLDLTNKKLNGIIKSLDIRKKEYTRGSKLISVDDVDRIELYLMEGKEI
jgi:hypothetical protein